MNPKGLYLYCVTCISEEKKLNIAGLSSKEVFLISKYGLSAIVSEYDKEKIGLDDIKIVSQLILTHQAVVDFAFEKYEVVVPFSFGTIMIPKDNKTACENLYEWLGKEKDSLNIKLTKFQGKAEYGIQISWDPVVVAPKVTKYDDEIKKLEEEIKLKNQGIAYMLKQKLGNLIKNKLESAADIYFKEFYKKIKEHSFDIKIEKIKKEKEPLIMLVNLSCLVDKDKTKELGDELDKIGKISGFHVRFTGPWAPYSFV